MSTTPSRAGYIFWTVFYWIETVALVAYTLSGMHFLWQRRDKYPIKTREPDIVWWLQLLGIISSIMVSIPALGFNPQSVSCASFGLGVMISMFMIALLLARFILLYFWSMLTNLAMNFHDNNVTLREKGVEKKPKVVIRGEWILRNRHRFNKRFWVIFVTCYFAIFGLPALFDALISFGKPWADASCGGLAYTAYGLYTLITVIAIFILWFQVRKIPENFKLIEEFKGIMYCGLYSVCFVAFDAVTQTQPSPDPTLSLSDYLLRNYNVTYLRFFFATCLLQWMFAYVQTHRVVRWSHENELAINGYSTVAGSSNKSSRESRGSSQVSINHSEAPNTPSQHSSGAASPRSDGGMKSVEELSKEFLELLLDPKGEQLFKGYLVKEFSVENLLFWKTVRRFKEIYTSENGHLDEKRLLHHSVKIYKQFVSMYAPLSINISSACKERLEKRLGIKDIVPSRQQVSSFGAPGATSVNVGAKAVEVDLEGKAPEASISVAGPQANPPEALDGTIFEEAQKEIFSLMVKDSFRRFRLAKEYKDFVATKMLAPIEGASPKNAALQLADKAGSSFFNFQADGAAGGNA
jgi:hypothetical protein